MVETLLAVLFLWRKVKTSTKIYCSSSTPANGNAVTRESEKEGTTGEEAILGFLLMEVNERARWPGSMKILEEIFPESRVSRISEGRGGVPGLKNSKKNTYWVGGVSTQFHNVRTIEPLSQMDYRTRKFSTIQFGLKNRCRNSEKIPQIAFIMYRQWCGFQRDRPNEVVVGFSEEKSHF